MCRRGVVGLQHGLFQLIRQEHVSETLPRTKLIVHNAESNRVDACSSGWSMQIDGRFDWEGRGEGQKS